MTVADILKAARTRREAEEGFEPHRRAAQQGFEPCRRSAQQGFEPYGRSAQQGFSLIELLVVIVIIGLLATIVAINVIPAATRRASRRPRPTLPRWTMRWSNIALDNLTYPGTSDGLQALLAPPPGLAQPERYRMGGYIKKLPEDPWGHPYLFQAPGRKGAFDVYSLGADGQTGGEGDNADIYSSDG